MQYSLSAPGIRLTFAAMVLLSSSRAVLAQEVRTPDVKSSSPLTEKFSIKIRPLAGSLDSFPLFNSNSPEIVPNSTICGPGILLSTLSPRYAEYPDAHLNYLFHGRFGVFMHHINKQNMFTPLPLRLRLCAYNPGAKPAQIVIEERATYLSQPDSPFKQMPPLMEILPDTSAGDSDQFQSAPYAGPGDRVTWEFLKGVRPAANSADEKKSPWQTVTVPPHTYSLVDQVSVPVRMATDVLKPPLNGRSYLAYMKSDRPVYLYLISDYKGEDDGDVSKPLSMDLVRPRESRAKMPSFPGDKNVVYGRVSGVSKGLSFVSHDDVKLKKDTALTLGYPVSSLARGTFGTKKIQAAPLLRRYFDSAFASHGNYCLSYKMHFKCQNSDSRVRSVSLRLACPVKEDKAGQKEVTFLNPADKAVWYRGTVRVGITGEDNQKVDRYFHLVLHKGEKPEPMLSFEIDPYAHKEVEVDLFYPPDATPPQLLMIESAI